MGVWAIIGFVVLVFVYSALAYGTYMFLSDQARFIHPIDATYRKATIFVITAAIAPPFILLMILSTFPIFLVMGLGKLVGLYW